LSKKQKNFYKSIVVSISRVSYVQESFFKERTFF